MEGVGTASGGVKVFLDMEETDLRLGLRLSLPGTEDPEKRLANKRSFPELSDDCGSSKGSCSSLDQESAQPPKAQIVGWPPIRSYRKNNLPRPKKAEGDGAASGIYVKVSVDGAPYLRKIDLKVYNGYQDLLKALEDMFKLTIGKISARPPPLCCFHLVISQIQVATYEDKDGDWMLVGDVPWEMFIVSCKRLRIMRGSEARGIGGSL